MKTLKLDGTNLIVSELVMPQTHVFCGGVKPLYVGGKVALKVTDAGENDYTGRFVCSVYGWKRWYTVGAGTTVEKAIQDWCDLTGNDREFVRENTVTLPNT